MKKKIVWYSATEGIAQMGPYPTQVAAWESIRLSAQEMSRRGYARPYSDDAIVWCEYAQRKGRKA